MRSAEIGNKQLIRAFGDVLKPLDVKQFPGALSTEPIQFVVPLNLIPYKLVTRSDDMVVIPFGFTRVIFSTDPEQSDPPPMYRNENELRLVGGLSVSWNFLAAPTSGDKVMAQFITTDWAVGGGNVVWAGHVETGGVPMDNSHLFYNFGLDSATALNGGDRRGGDLHMPMLGWIPSGANLTLTLQYFDGATGALKAFPAVEFIVAKFLAVESPKGVIPPV